MNNLSMEQIYQTALDAGFPPATAAKMTAIAWKESGGNADAHNSVPPDDSYGLWQINMLGAMGDQRMAAWGLTSKSQLYDPATNARAAYALWGGSDANLNTAWAIGWGVNQQRYQQFLPAAQAAAGRVELARGGSPPNPTTPPPTPPQSAGGTAATPDWTRVAQALRDLAAAVEGGQKTRL